jgi:hypothetical protein
LQPILVGVVLRGHLAGPLALLSLSLLSLPSPSPSVFLLLLFAALPSRSRPPAAPPPRRRAALARMKYAGIFSEDLRFTSPFVFFLAWAISAGLFG